MKKIVSFIVFAFLQLMIFAQFPNSAIDSNSDTPLGDYQLNNTTNNSWDGFSISPVGQFRVLNILINIIYDVTPGNDPSTSLDDPWPQALIGQEGINTVVPNWVPDSSLFDVHYNAGSAINGTFTRKYYESSFGALHLIGDYVVITIPQSYIIAGNPEPMSNGQFEFTTLLDRSLEFLNIHGGLQTVFGYNSIHDYDLNSNDTVYFASISTRNTQSYTSQNVFYDYGNYNANNGTAGSFNKSILFPDGQFYRVRLSLLQCVGSSRHLVENPVAAIYHEFGHCLFGINNMHSSGGNGWSDNTGRTFLPRMGGFGLMGHSGSGMVSANGFDRWWLHWKSPTYNTSISYIAASNQSSDITQADGTKNFILRDFVTTGDAIRIKLPYTDNGAKNQYIWLENHKIGTNNKLDFLTYSNKTPCRPVGKAGIYAFYQIGKDVLSGDNIRPHGESDHLRLISAEGNFNYDKRGDVVLNCFNTTTDNGHGRQLDPNPLMGCNDAMIQFHDTLNTLKIADDYVFLLDAKDMFINGQWVRNDSMPYLMDERDAFRGTRSFNLSSNPAPLNTTTYYNTNDNDGNISVNTLYGLVNNNTIYLSGLNITMAELTNGDYKVTIDWGHSSLDNSVAWTGKIALVESLYVYDNDTLLLKQNKTPTQVNRNNITGLFAPYSTFECRENSEMYLSNNSRTILSEKSKFYIQAGSIVTVQNNAKLIVKSGCELIIEDCGNLVIRENGQLVVEPGGILTIKTGANVFMDGIANINLQSGFLTGIGGIAITMSNALVVLGVPPLKQIIASTTWTVGTYKFFDDLYISAGATLNLNGTTLKFFRNAKAKVARGAKLNMAGNSKLTTTCGDELWQGVEVWGNPGISQSPTTNQGHVVMNNSTIEYAKTGVLLDRPMPIDGPGVPSGNGGGIIQAFSSTFSNNYIGVSFSGYTIYDNISTFSNCLFTANSSFPEMFSGIDCHANLNGVIGIDFLKCTFSVTSGIINNAGIRSYNSNFLVDGIINPINRLYHRSVFENLKHGIYATSSLSNRNFTVKNTVFRTCTKGVFASGISNLKIINNKFAQPLLIGSPTYKLIGIYLEYCTGYTIQYDTLLCYTGNNARSEVGMYIKNSGPNENLIYNNVILFMNEGIITEGENRYDEFQGLCIKCNDFRYNRNDVRILPGENTWLFNQGIKRYQGSSGNLITDPAGNTFSNPAVQFNIDNEICRPIEYFHHAQAGQFILRPPDNKVRIFEKTVKLILNDNSNPYSKPNACPPIPILADSKQELISGAILVDGEIATKQAQLESYIDDNDTPLLVNNINSSAPFEALWLYDELLDASPYLSDTALIAAAKKEEVLNSALIRDVMVANPHSAKSNEVMEALEQRVEPIPDELMVEIKAGKNQISARQALEITISDLSAKKANTRTQLLQTYQAENNNDSIRWVLEQFNEPLSAYQHAWTWFDQGNTGYGITEIQNIDLASIPVNHREYHIGFNQLAVIINQLTTDTTFSLLSDTASLETLFSLANEDNPAGISARNLLSAYRLLNYEATVQIPDTTLKSSLVTEDQRKHVKADNSPLQLFPNPATDYTIVSYHLENDGEMILVSSDGRIVNSFNLKTGNNQMLIRTTDLTPGIYSAKLIGAKELQSVKLIIK